MQNRRKKWRESGEKAKHGGMKHGRKKKGTKEGREKLG